VAGQGTLATTLITTKGLFTAASMPPGYTALTFGAVITPWFRLYIQETVPPSGYVDAAGSKPYAPGEIAQLYQPIDPKTGLRIDAKNKDMEEYLVVPVDKEAEYLAGNRIITVKLNFAGKELEKVYSVSEHRAQKIIEVINVVNATRNRISVVAKGLRRVATEAVVSIRNLRLRNKHDK